MLRPCLDRRHRSPPQLADEQRIDSLRNR
jgi:hypothetical protein